MRCPRPRPCGAPDPTLSHRLAIYASATSTLTRMILTCADTEMATRRINGCEMQYTSQHYELRRGTFRVQATGRYLPPNRAPGIASSVRESWRIFRSATPHRRR